MLKIGTVIGLPDDGKKLKVLSVLGSGTQSIVYEVDLDGQKKALKVFKTSFTQRLKNPAKFMENIQHNIARGSPDRSFLWPEMLFFIKGENYGYTMPLVPSSYHPMNDFLSRKVHFKSFKYCSHGCIALASAFRALHIKGLFYGDINGGNFFFSPRGDVLIGDAENVIADGVSTGVSLSTPRFAAPELILGRRRATMDSDRLSLGIVLFMLLTQSHPFEGKLLEKEAYIGIKARKKIQGRDPVFLFDKTDASNRPLHGVPGADIYALWNELPEYIRNLFCLAFSKKAICTPSARVIEADFIKAFMRFQAGIAHCTCGNDVLDYIQHPVKTCPQCGKALEPLLIQSRRFAYPVVADEGTFIYRSMLSDTINHSKEKAFEIYRSNGKLALWNLSGKNISAGSKTVPPKGGVFIRRGSCFQTPYGALSFK